MKLHVSRRFIPWFSEERALTEEEPLCLDCEFLARSCDANEGDGDLDGVGEGEREALP